MRQRHTASIVAHECGCRQMTWCHQRTLSSIRNVAFVSVFILTGVNIFITLSLISSPNSKEHSNNDLPTFGGSARRYAQRSDCSKCKGLMDVDPGLKFHALAGRNDASHVYKIHEFVRIGDHQNSSSMDAGGAWLATQATVDRMFWLVDVSRHWQGPMSVALFVPGPDFIVAVHFMTFLRRCFPQVRANVTFHFAYPTKHPPHTEMDKRDLTSNVNINVSCSKYFNVLQELLNTRSREDMQWRQHLLYPQNLMRNVARKGCQSEFVLLTDIDIIPRWGLSAKMDEFVKNKEVLTCSKCAFVVPTYEVDEKVPLPVNKTSLLALVKSKKAQPFHQVVFVNNQFATNFSMWQTVPDAQQLSVAYAVTNFEFYYEPFYLAQDSAPSHDERFVGYGFTRNTQVYEMFVAGYKFLVLNSAFAMHRGIKIKKSRQAWREKQNRANWKLLKNFEKEIHVKYGREPKSKNAISSKN